MASGSEDRWPLSPLPLAVSLRKFMRGCLRREKGFADFVLEVMDELEADWVDHLDLDGIEVYGGSANG